MNLGEILVNLWETSGLYGLFGKLDWQSAVMIGIACVLLYLGIVKQYEPLLMVGIAFGILLTNIPFGDIYHPAFCGTDIDYLKVLHDGGLVDMLYMGV